MPVRQNLQSFLSSQKKADQEFGAHTSPLGMNLSWAKLH